MDGGRRQEQRNKTMGRDKKREASKTIKSKEQGEKVKRERNIIGGRRANADTGLEIPRAHILQKRIPIPIPIRNQAALRKPSTPARNVSSHNEESVLYASRSVLNTSTIQHQKHLDRLCASTPPTPIPPLRPPSPPLSNSTSHPFPHHSFTAPTSEPSARDG